MDLTDNGVVKLHCALSLAAQCIVIGPVCGHACSGRAGRQAVSVTTITRNCVHRCSPNWVCRCRYWPSPAD